MTAARARRWRAVETESSTGSALVREDEIEQRAQLTRRRRGLSHRPQGFCCGHSSLQRLGSARSPAAPVSIVFPCSRSARGEGGVLGERVEAVPPSEVLQLPQPRVERADARPDRQRCAGEGWELPVRRTQ